MFSYTLDAASDSRGGYIRATGKSVFRDGFYTVGYHDFGLYLAVNRNHVRIVKRIRFGVDKRYAAPRRNIRNVDFRKSDALRKRAGAYLLDALRDRYLVEFGATRERRLTYNDNASVGRYNAGFATEYQGLVGYLYKIIPFGAVNRISVRNGYADEFFAVTERRLSDALDAASDRYGFDRGASVKRVFGYTLYAVRNNEVYDLLTVQVQITCIVKRICVNVFKRNAAPRGNVVYFELFKSRATVKRIASYADYALRNSYLFKFRATRKRRFSYTCDASVGRYNAVFATKNKRLGRSSDKAVAFGAIRGIFFINRDAYKFFTTLKHRSTYALDAVSDTDAFKVGTIQKSVF